MNKINKLNHRLKSVLRSSLKSSLSQLSYIRQTLHLVWSAAGYWTVGWAVLLVFQGVLPVASVYLTRWLVDSLVAVVGRGVSWESIQIALVPTLSMAVVLLLGEFLQSAAIWIRTAQAELVQDYISSLVHSKSVNIDLGCYESSEYHDHLNRARSGAGGRSLALLENIGSLLQNSITFLAMAALLFTYGIWLPIVLLVSALPAFYVLLRLNRRQHEWWQRRTIERRWLEYYEILLTSSTFAAEMRLFNLGSYFQSAYQDVRVLLRKENLHIVKQQSLGRLAAGLMTLLISGGALAWMGQQVLLGAITLGDLALFYQAFNRGQGLMKSLLGNLGQLYENTLFISNLFEFLRLQSKITNPTQPVPTPGKLKQEIRFRQITFRYPGCERPVLENFNLTLPVGKIVAIVGDNGAGKSTLTKLLCRFYDPEAGSVEIDGIDIRNFTVEELREVITILFQFPAPYFVNATQNIALGDLSASANAAKIEAAAKAAGVHETIMRLPQGYDSMLGKWFPGGNDLSGGEWQRLALARSFFRHAQIIILDEPTSAMDPWAEHDWLERFRTLAQGRTAIVITHRFTLAMRADVVHVMRAGRIFESGSHDELLAKDGLYAQSWKSQMEANSNEAVESNVI